MSGEAITLKGTVSAAPTCDGRRHSVELRTNEGTALIQAASGNVGAVIAELRQGDPVSVVGTIRGDLNIKERRIIEAAHIQTGRGALAGPGRLRTHGDARRGWDALAADAYARRKAGAG
jgi:hypothetical protein